jgi:hypothetical protein
MPIAVNPDQVLYVCPAGNKKEKKTTIAFSMEPKNDIVVEGEFEEILAKLNGRRITRVGAL